MNSNDYIIRMFNVHKRYGALNALVNINLDISHNEFIFITGPSGAGKTTLIKLLYLGEKVSEGYIIVDGMNLKRLDPKRIPFLRRKIGIVFQDFRLIPEKTVFENIALVLEAAGLNRQYIQKKINSLLRKAGLEEKIDMYPPSLSGGEQQRVAVLRAVVGDPKIILADEPTGSLDAVSAKKIMDLLIEYHQRGTTVLVSTHNQALIESIPAKVISLHGGNLDSTLSQ
ncbi:MAG: cell division ATP-binding protein FtsE [Desulfobacterales bacterium]|nr:cell division ATP-binding protein FtsE [Desulfobacterales bacterium]